MKKILITMGEPAGIGAEIIAQSLLKNWHADITVCGDPDLLNGAAKQLQCQLQLAEYGTDAAHQAKIKIIPITTTEKVITGTASAGNRDYVLTTLAQASDLMLANKFDALITAPVQKSTLHSQEQPFQGHTEFFAKRAKCEQVVMMLASENIKVATATTHIPLNSVHQQISTASLIKTATIIHQDLVTKFGISHPEIITCGLNPHAGESGTIGTEELTIIQPAIAKLQQQGINIRGPVSADTVFNHTNFAKNKVILTMYHDQGLPAFKALTFGNSSNITLGLPYFRSSVDHGTALDIAGKRIAKADSLNFAIKQAIEI